MQVPSAPLNSHRLRSQKWMYELSGVSLPALGDQAFANAIQHRGICCLSQNRGLDTDTVLAVLPPAELVLAVDGLTFERLGIEEPAQGAGNLRKKLLPGGRRHLRIELGISKTRMKRASPAQAISRWRSLAPPEECCTLLAYCDRDGAEAYDFAPLLGPGVIVKRIEVPIATRSIRLGDAASPRSGAAAIRPPLEALVNGLAGGQASYGEACEDLLDWIGLLHLDIGGCLLWV